jgi:hypothetical protein
MLKFSHNLIEFISYRFGKTFTYCMYSSTDYIYSHVAYINGHRQFLPFNFVSMAVFTHLSHGHILCSHTSFPTVTS